ncbi:Winged helix-turn helix, partial [Trichococcus flocculiformis]
METERQIRELEKAMTTTDNRRLYERCLAVKLVLEGHTRKEAGHTIGRDEHTVSHYVKNYCHNGIQGLVSKKQSGRPSRLTDEQE